MDNVDDSVSDMSDIDPDAPENRIDSSAASIFSLFQYRSLHDRSPDTNSSSDSENHQDEEYSALDEHTRSLACEHQVIHDAARSTCALLALLLKLALFSIWVNWNRFAVAS